MPRTADFWVLRPPACKPMKRYVELGLGIPARSGQQSPLLQCWAALVTPQPAALALSAAQPVCLLHGHLAVCSACTDHSRQEGPSVWTSQGSTRAQTRHHGRQGVVSFCFTFFSWLCWNLVAMHRLSLVAVSRGDSSLQCVGFSVWWSLLCRAQALGSGALIPHRLSSCCSWAL